jgi:Uma2 family endonuclease
MVSALPAGIATVADLLRHLGGVSPARVRCCPMPGKARERDVLKVERCEGRLCELVDGTLVEKILGLPKARLIRKISTALDTFMVKRELAFALLESGMTRLGAGLIRIADISCYLLQDNKLPEDPISRIVPALTVEVVSKANTRQEVARKLKEYFLAGTRLAWIIDPRKRQAKVHTAPDEFALLGEDGALDGGEVLPGFRLRLRPLLALLPQPKKRGKRGRKR